MGDALPLVGMMVHDDGALFLLGKQANQDKREVRKDYPLLLVLEYLGRDIYNHLEEFQS